MTPAALEKDRAPGAADSGADATNPATTVTAPVADTVDLSPVNAEKPSTLWREVASLSAAASVPGPLGALLSDVGRTELGALVERLYAAGFKIGTSIPSEEALSGLSDREKYWTETSGPFRQYDAKSATEAIVASRWNQLDMAVSGGDIEYAPLTRATDLRTLEALYIDPQELTHLDHPALAQALSHIQATIIAAAASPWQAWKASLSHFTQQHYDGPHSFFYGVGRYGAYKALTEGHSTILAESPQVQVLGNAVAPTVTLHSEEEALAADYFAFNGPCQPLRDPVLATSLRSLKNSGYSLFDTESGLQPYTGYLEWVKRPDAEFAVGVGGLPIQRVHPQDLDPSTFSSDVRSAREIYVQELKPLIDNRSLQGDEADALLAECARPYDGLDFAGQWSLLKRVWRQEQALGVGCPAPEAVNTFSELKNMSTPGLKLPALVDEYCGLRATLQQPLAIELLRYIRAGFSTGAGTLNGLSSELLDEAQIQHEKADLVRLATATGGLEAARQARELVLIDPAPGSDSREDRLEAMLGLLELEKTVNCNPRRDFVERSLNDYLTILSYKHKDQSVRDAANAFMELRRWWQDWCSCVDAFRFLQSGTARFHGRTEEEAYCQVLQDGLAGIPLKEACLKLLSPPRRPEELSIEKGPGVVRIAGISVTVRDEPPTVSPGATDVSPETP